MKGFPRPALSRRQFAAMIGSGLALPAAGCRAQPAGRPINLREMGAVGDGSRDDGPAFARALAAAQERGVPLLVPAGTFLITDRAIHAGARFVALSGMTVFGEGAASVLKFRRALSPSFYGIAVEGRGIGFRDLTFEVDRAGGGYWVAAVAVTAYAADLAFDRVAFRGAGTREGLYGMLPINADIDGLVMRSCHFQGLDFGFAKQTSDVSTQTGITIEDCTGIDCTEVLEFNSPGLFRGHVSANSPIVSDVAEDTTDGPFDTAKLRPGMPVRSIYFPSGTQVAAIEAGRRIRLSRSALRTSPRGDKARLSAGGCRGGVIRNLRVRHIHQWAVGFSNCEDWQVDIRGEDVAYELVHVEDGSRRLDIVAGGVRCNLRTGVVGSPRAENGMVNVSTGSSDITVRFADADLRQSAGGSPIALAVQAGGPMGTTGLEVPPAGVRVTGRVLMSAGCQAVVAYDADLTIADLELVNDPRSRASPMMTLSGSNWRGTLRVRHPGVLIRPHPRLRGRFDRVVTLAT